MRALIIGGGIGGLSAGIALRRAGWDVAVFERAPAFGAVGAGLTLWANAVKALDSLGVGQALRAGAFVGGNGGVRTWRGRMLLAMSPDEMERLTGAPSVAVHRAELIEMLLAAFGRDAVRVGAQCLEFLQNDDGVLARFADGTVEHGDVLVGADGLNSVVRAGLFGTAPPRYAGYTAYRGVVAYDGRDVVYGESLGPGMRFGLVPLLGGRIYWFAAANAPENDPAPADGQQAELLRRFGHWHAPIPEVIRRTDPAAILRNDIYDREPMDRWGEGRVTLLGDAAHPMTPNLGQGACQAIEDAVALGWCLKDIDDPADIPAALRNYESRRIPRTARIVRFSRRYGRFAQAENPVACWVRDRLLAWTPGRTQMKHVAGLINGA